MASFVLLATGCVAHAPQGAAETEKGGESGEVFTYPAAGGRSGEYVGVMPWRFHSYSPEAGEPLTSQELLDRVLSTAAHNRIGTVHALRVVYHAGTTQERSQIIRPVTLESIEAARICYACAHWIMLVTDE